MKKIFIVRSSPWNEHFATEKRTYWYWSKVSPRKLWHFIHISVFHLSCFWDPNAKLCLSTFQWEAILYSSCWSSLSFHFITANSLSKKRFTRKGQKKFYRMVQFIEKIWWCLRPISGIWFLATLWYRQWTPDQQISRGVKCFFGHHYHYHHLHYPHYNNLIKLFHDD